MTNSPDRRLAGAALVLLIMAGLWALPAKAEGVPASFDCAKAESAPAVINAVAWHGDISYARFARRTLVGEGEEGGWKLENHLFGAEKSLPVYPPDMGVIARSEALTSDPYSLMCLSVPVFSMKKTQHP